MHIFWSIGFRPFFFTGSLVSVSLILFWAVVFFNEALPTGYFDPIYWHAHEMIFGFVTSIVSGFLLTASANWTRTQPLSGNRLKYLFFLWLAGRIAFALSLFDLPVSNWVYFILDISFIPALIFFLSKPLIQARQIRNIQFLFVLFLLMTGNLLTHLASLEVIDYEYAGRGIYLGVNLILLIVVIIGGRIVPFFSMNAVPGMQVKKYDSVEYAVLISLWLFILLDFIKPQSSLTGGVALFAGIVNLVRIIGWQSWKTLKNPLLWILHLGYLWIVAGFFLISLSDLIGTLPRSVAIHAFTAGAMGTFIIGMISRVSLGHTGRPLILPRGFVLSYLLVLLSAFLRVIFGFIPDHYNTGILLSGICWAGSFLLFLIYYAPILLLPRPDGR